MLALATLRTPTNRITYMLGTICTTAVYLAAIIGFMRQIVYGIFLPSWKRTGIAFAWGLMFAIYGVGMMHSEGVWHRLYPFVLLFFVFCMFAWTSSLDWNTAAARRFAASLIISLIIIWAMMVAATHSASGFVPVNKNILGLFSLIGISACMVGITASKGQSYRFLYVAVIIALVVLLVLSESRATWMAAACMVATYLLYPLILRRALFYTLWCLALIGFVLFCVNINTNKWREETSMENDLAAINQKLAENKSLSTRAKVWIPVVESINEHPLAGLGLGASVNELVGLNLSAHSIYLQIGLQTGYPGMCAFILLLYLIGLAFTRRADDYRFGRLGLAMLIGFALQDAFEASLTENNMSSAACIWTMLGICLYLHYSGRPLGHVKQS